MVSHCQTPAFPDFTGLTFSVYGSKSDICARRAGNGGFGSQICRSPYDTPIHMNCVSPKRLSAPEEKAHLSTTTPRSCFSLPQVQGSYHGAVPSQLNELLAGAAPEDYERHYIV
ncbi:hypothetical protein EXN66_Car006687 [Channa argus]|uniref:Uncharacterized protein n=1 Tax=Channa argus TaxID=215402 RepID=A0A6G1PLE6_CHAAH|nr:hypothetical protein EXN66_Car006687 [Channa argus]